MSDKKTIRNRVVDPGYRLPATIEPGEDVCIRVYVPKDSLYLAAFWAQYEKLGMWLSWERGGTRAKDAASSWKVRIAKAREINDCAEGDCGIMNVRQKPNYPCILQKWDDCESEWVDFADTRLCVPMMRVNGLGELEQWNGTEWVSAKPDEGAGGTYEPGHDLENQLSNWVDPPVGEDGQCLSAINAVTYLQAAIDASMIELKELPYLVRLLDSIITTWYWRVYNFAAFATSMVTGLIWSLSWEDAHKLMSDKSLTHEDDIIAVDIIDDTVCLFYDAYNEDGTVSEAGYNDLMGALQDAIDNETPNSAKAMKLEWLMLLSFPGPTWLANISNNAGINSYSCGCTGWEHTFDFAVNNGGWSTANIPNNAGGNYGAGGWAHYDLTEGDSYRMVGIGRAFDETSITKMTARFTIARGDYQYPTYAFYWFSTVSDVVKVVWPADLVDGDNEVTFEFNSPFSTEFVRLIIRSSMNASAIFSGSILLTSVTMWGNGDNPFL